jgi:hypothetical protein
MADLTKMMHDKGILPNVALVDVDTQNPNGLQFTDQNGAQLSRDSSSIDNNLGAIGNLSADITDPRQLMLKMMGISVDDINKSGLDIDDPNQFADLLQAKMMGVDLKRNPDGSFDVDFDLKKALNMFNKAGSLFDGMISGLADSPSGSQQPEEEPQPEETA